MQAIRQELKNFEKHLDNDREEFQSKLNFTRKTVSDFIDQQIEFLTKIKNDFIDEFNYLEDQNDKTCTENQYEFERLCILINQNDHNLKIIGKLFNDFKQKFSLRPKMLKSIPEYEYKSIQIDDLIIKQTSTRSSTISTNCSSPVQNQSHPTSSIGSSYHKQFAAQNCEHRYEIQTRLTSSCQPENQFDVLLEIPYEHNGRPHLICLNTDENFFLIYSFSSHQFQYLPLNSCQIIPMNISLDDSINTLGYSSNVHLFYYIKKYTNYLIFFQLNQKDKQIIIRNDIELINNKDRLIIAHIFENFIYYLYLTESAVTMFGKYDLDQMTIVRSIRIRNKFFDNGEKSYFKILDFTIDKEVLYLLIQVKNQTKSQIHFHNLQTMNPIYSINLIDSFKPLSIISIETNQLLLFINDPEGQVVHCCTDEQYLLPICLSNFGMCSSNDGNLVLITRNNIRILKFIRKLKKTK